MNHDLLEKVVAWIAADPDANDRATLERLLGDANEEELERRFGVPLTFGTAGLRGPVMAGPAGMNRLSVRRATQGVIAWLAEIGVDSSRGVVVGRDARWGSELFNDEVVTVLLGAGVVVWEMPEPLPTPFVAYAVKSLGAAAGIMITASHNPSTDNGYKLYGADGAQIIPPNDELVQDFAASAAPAVLATRASVLHHVIDAALFVAYRDHFVERFGVAQGSDLRITYTPLHGVGGRSMIELLDAAGYRHVTTVDEQFAPDPDFPTLDFPNPEEDGALDIAMSVADAVSSSLVIANDPDADRLAVAVHRSGGWRVLRGDEIGWLLASTLVATMKPNDVVATSIVSSTMLEAIAAQAHVQYAVTLTGFKWIARAAGEAVLRFGYEEALGFAVDPAVADKDGLSAALAICRLAHDLAQRGGSLLELLDDLENRFGVHAVDQLSLRAEGPGAAQRIARAVQHLRTSAPSSLGKLPVTEVADLAQGWRGLAPTDGVLLVLGSTGRVVVRPSGTEAKLKAYLEITGAPGDADTLDSRRSRAREQLDEVRASLARHVRL